MRTLPGWDVPRLGPDPVVLDLVLDDGPHLRVAAADAAQSLLCGPYAVMHKRSAPGASPDLPTPGDRKSRLTGGCETPMAHTS